METLVSLVSATISIAVLILMLGFLRDWGVCASH